MYVSRKAVPALTLLAFVGVGASKPAAAQTYNVSTDFSTTNNPNNGGAWSYGYENTLGSGFTLDSSNDPQILSSYGNTNIQGWAAVSGGFSQIFFNTTNSIQSVPRTAITLQPYQVALHPSGNDQYAVVRFTAPSTGLYALNTLFSSVDGTGATTDVHVLLDNTALFNGNVNGAGSTQTYAPAPLNLTGGNTLDFAVGYGSDDNYFYDSTALATTITRASVNPTVPEPGTLPLLGLGFAGVALAARRRRRA